MCQVLSFDHRKSATSKIDSAEDCLENTTFHIDLEKCSATTAYEYFSQKLAEMNLPISGGSVLSLLNSQDRDRLEMVLKYIEDTALQKWSLADTKAFLTGISDWRSKLNCITNPYMYEQVCNLILIILSCICHQLVCQTSWTATSVKGQPMHQAAANVGFEKGRCK